MNWLVALYLITAVAANCAVGMFGPIVLPITALVMIPFELTVRDVLHDKWNGSFARLSALVLAGSVASWFVAPPAVCIASAAGFFLAGLSDWSVYVLMAKSKRWKRMLGSNTISAIVDSVVFQAVAFRTISLEILIVQCGLKIVGGTVGVALLTKWKKETC